MNKLVTARPYCARIIEARPGVTIAMVPDGNTVEFLQNTSSK
ncbi:MAG TPA: hypothetical protein VMF50_13505 [Candidatus Binataceae bacterium]|nr:hypothetical protein [Candidatus Binataceae bacterium]